MLFPCCLIVSSVVLPAAPYHPPCPLVLLSLSCLVLPAISCCRLSLLVLFTPSSCFVTLHMVSCCPSCCLSVPFSSYYCPRLSFHLVLSSVLYHAPCPPVLSSCHLISFSLSYFFVFPGITLCHPPCPSVLLSNVVPDISFHPMLSSLCLVVLPVLSFCCPPCFNRSCFYSSCFHHLMLSSLLSLVLPAVSVVLLVISE